MAKRRRRRRIKTNPFIDAVLERTAMFRRVELGAAQEIEGLLTEIRAQIIARIIRLLAQSVDPATGNLVDNANTRARARATLREVDRALERGVAETTDKLEELRLAAFRRGILDATFQASQVGVDITTSFTQMFDEALRLSQTQPVLGVSPQNAFRGTEANFRRVVRREVGRGIASGQGVAETARRIQEQTDTTQSAAKRIARTNLNATYNDAHRMLYNSNPQIFVGYRWDATFDSRTSDICASLHGTFYPVGSISPGPPAHWNCRSKLVGVFRDPKVEAAATGPRRVRTFDDKGDMTGSELIASTASFDSWLRRQPKSVIKRVTGSPVKQKLFSAGKISLRDIVGDNLVTRSDANVLARALARRPKDKALRKQLKELGGRKRTQKSIEAADRRTQREVRHTIGTRRRMSLKERKRIERLDKGKRKRTRDRVRSGAERIAKDAGTI